MSDAMTPGLSRSSIGRRRFLGTALAAAGSVYAGMLVPSSVPVISVRSRLKEGSSSGSNGTGRHAYEMKKRLTR